MMNPIDALLKAISMGAWDKSCRRVQAPVGQFFDRYPELKESVQNLKSEDLEKLREDYVLPTVKLFSS